MINFIYGYYSPSTEIIRFCLINITRTANDGLVKPDHRRLMILFTERHRAIEPSRTLTECDGKRSSPKGANVVSRTNTTE
jgi:hypothetical protein